MPPVATVRQRDDLGDLCPESPMLGLRVLASTVPGLAPKPRDRPDAEIKLCRATADSRQYGGRRARERRCPPGQPRGAGARRRGGGSIAAHTSCRAGRPRCRRGSTRSCSRASSGLRSLLAVARGHGDGCGPGPSTTHRCWPAPSVCSAPGTSSHSSWPGCPCPISPARTWCSRGCWTTARLLFESTYHSLLLLLTGYSAGGGRGARQRGPDRLVPGRPLLGHAGDEGGRADPRDGLHPAGDGAVHQRVRLGQRADRAWPSGSR